MPLTRRRFPARLSTKAEAAFFLCFVSFGFALPKRLLLRRWTDDALNRPAGEADARGGARALAGDVESAARRLPFKTRCLQKSLALGWMLQRRGIGGQLQIGVRPGGDGILAHAWIEIAAEPVNDTPYHCAAFTVLRGTQELPEGAILAEDAA